MEERMTMTKEQMLGELYKCRLKIMAYIRVFAETKDMKESEDVLNKVIELKKYEVILKNAIENGLYTDTPMPVNESLRNDIKRIFGR